MTEEKRIILNGENHIVVISDEPEALLAAKAAGRAVVAVDASLGTAAMAGSKDIPGRILRMPRRNWPIWFCAATWACRGRLGRPSV